MPIALDLNFLPATGLARHGLLLVEQWRSSRNLDIWALRVAGWLEKFSPNSRSQDMLHIRKNRGIAVLLVGVLLVL
jgi:hypothetical protein